MGNTSLTRRPSQIAALSARPLQMANTGARIPANFAVHMIHLSIFVSPLVLEKGTARGILNITSHTVHCTSEVEFRFFFQAILYVPLPSFQYGLLLIDITLHKW